MTMFSKNLFFYILSSLLISACGGSSSSPRQPEIPVNKPPEHTGNLSAELGETDPPQAFDLLAGASDPDGDRLAVTRFTASPDGSNVGITLESGTMTIDPKVYANKFPENQSLHQIQYNYFISDGSLEVAQSFELTIRRAPIDLSEYLDTNYGISTNFSFPLDEAFTVRNKTALLQAILVNDIEAVKDIVSVDACIFSYKAFKEQTMRKANGAALIDIEEYCISMLNQEQLGNAATLDEETQQWRQSPGTQYNIGLESLTSRHLPYMKQTRYKTTTRTKNNKGIAIANVFHRWNAILDDEAHCDIDTYEQCISDIWHKVDSGDYLESVKNKNKMNDWATYEDARKACANEHDENCLARLASDLEQGLFEKPLSGVRHWVDLIALEKARRLCSGPNLDECRQAIDLDLENGAYEVVTETCELEMRIYKKDTHRQNLKPLIMFHGGAWKYRGFAFAALESQIAHFTEDEFSQDSFVAFVPFYRLTNDKDGNKECNNFTWREITEDAEDALAWVKEYGEGYGASTTDAYLFGQSAGGHLAGWLASHRNEDVEKALILYAPVDFLDYTKRLQREAQIQGNEVFRTTNAKVAATFLETDLSKVNIDQPPEAVLKNSFPYQASISSVSPMYLIHGTADNTVDWSQAGRMCNALSGADTLNSGVIDLLAAPPISEAGKQFFCGNNSYLDLLKDIDHAADICVPNKCPARDMGVESAVKEALIRGRRWLQQ